MNLNKKIIITSLLLVFFFTSSSVSLTNTSGFNDDSSMTEISCEGSDTFIEDFYTDVYKSSSTTALGWGSGALTNLRDYSWQFLDYFNTTFPVRSVDVQGRKVYVGQFDDTDSTDSIGCYDINNPSDIQLLSQRLSLPRTLTFVVDGDVGYAGTDFSSQQFSPYNISNPIGFDGGGVYLGSMAADGPVNDIDPEGYLVYYTVYKSTSGYSLRVVNAENPNTLVPYTASWNSDQALGLEVEGQLAFVAASIEGLYVLNVTNRNAFVEIGHVGLPGNATDVILDGGFAYVACGDAGVALVDIRDPTNPILRDVYDTDGLAIRLALQGNTLFVADGPGGVCVLDVASHSHLTYVTKNPMPFVWDVDLYGGILVVGNDDGIHTFRICAGLGILDFADSYYVNAWSDFQVWDVRVIGDIAYIAGGPDGFYTLNIRDPNNPILLDHVVLPGIYRKLDVKGTFAHVVADGHYYMFDVQDPSNIILAGHVLGNDLLDVFIQGDLAYLTWQHGSYVVLNMSVPTSWYVVDEPLFGGSNITAIWVQGPHVYVTSANEVSEDSVFVYQTLDLSNQEFASALASWSRYYDIKVDGDLGYASDRDWLVVYNFTDPYNPVWINDVNIGAGYILSNGVWTFGPYIMNAGGSMGAHLVNATDVPTYTGTNYANATGALQITSCGDYTYVANMSSLVILRHFESAGDTYIPGNVMAQSTNVSSVSGMSIINATLKVDMLDHALCSYQFYLSNDGGVNWEPVTANVAHVFVNTGQELLWKVELTGLRDRSNHIFSVEIDYNYEEAKKASMEFIPVGVALILLSIFVTSFYVPKKKLNKKK